MPLLSFLDPSLDRRESTLMRATETRCAFLALSCALSLLAYCSSTRSLISRTHELDPIIPLIIGAPVPSRRRHLFTRPGHRRRDGCAHINLFPFFPHHVSGPAVQHISGPTLVPISRHCVVEPKACRKTSQSTWPRFDWRCWLSK